MEHETAEYVLPNLKLGDLIKVQKSFALWNYDHLKTLDTIINLNRSVLLTFGNKDYVLFLLNENISGVLMYKVLFKNKIGLIHYASIKEV